MRKYEFRVWNKRNSTMLYEGWNGDVFVDKGKIFAWGEDAEVMQYTGVKDRNENKIFEGDIIITSKGVCPVTFENGCFYAKTVSNYRLGGWKKETITVIGNIFEDGHLLNEPASLMEVGELVESASQEVSKLSIVPKVVEQWEIDMNEEASKEYIKLVQSYRKNGRIATTVFWGFILVVIVSIIIIVVKLT
jgi:hypothetical protein